MSSRRVRGPPAKGTKGCLNCRMSKSTCRMVNNGVGCGRCNAKNLTCGHFAYILNWTHSRGSGPVFYPDDESPQPPARSPQQRKDWIGTPFIFVPQYPSCDYEVTTAPPPGILPPAPSIKDRERAKRFEEQWNFMFMDGKRTSQRYGDAALSPPSPSSDSSGAESPPSPPRPLSPVMLYHPYRRPPPPTQPPQSRSCSPVVALRCAPTPALSACSTDSSGSSPARSPVQATTGVIFPPPFFFLPQRRMRPTSPATTFSDGCLPSFVPGLPNPSICPPSPPRYFPQKPGHYTSRRFVQSLPPVLPPQYVGPAPKAPPTYTSRPPPRAEELPKRTQAQTSQGPGWQARESRALQTGWDGSRVSSLHPPLFVGYSALHPNTLI